MDQFISVSAFLKFGVIFTISFLTTIHDASCRSVIDYEARSSSMKKMDPISTNDNELITLDPDQKLDKILSKYETSCGKITCDDVENYPETLIKELLKKYNMTSKQTKQIRPSSYTEQFPDRYYPLLLASFASYSGTPYIRRRRPVEIPRKLTCAHQVLETHPKEALDHNKKSHILVNLEGLKELRGKSCTAEKFCKDDRTPVGYINYCESRIKTVIHTAVDSHEQVLYEAAVRITDGCKCKLVKEQLINQRYDQENIS